MSSHALTVAGYLAVLGAAILLELAGHLVPDRVPRLGELLSRAMRTRTGRVGVLVGWAWLGLHFFAR